MRKERLLATLHELEAFAGGAQESGVTRFSWTAADGIARNILRRELEALGLEVYSDGIGNVRAVYKGKSDLARIVTGSHLDSVRQGGALDGAYGVAASLEALRSFHEQGYRPLRDIEFIAFAEEEGSNYGCTCLGSKAVCGQVDVAALKALRNASGSCYDTLQAFGLDPDNLPQQQLDPLYVFAFVEVHIEQGLLLEAAGTPLGIVDAICGMRLLQITLHGRSGHAAAPMHGRRDPMSAFAEFVRRMEDLRRNATLPEDFCFTVGSISAMPGVGIVIPDSVTFSVDLRHVDTAVLEDGRRHLEQILQTLAAERSLTLDVRLLSASGGTRMSPEIQEMFYRAARQRGIEPLSLHSGPAHDAASVGACVPAGLLFIPCREGLSHCPEEAATPEHLALGAEILEATLRQLADTAQTPHPHHPTTPEEVL